MNMDADRRVSRYMAAPSRSTDIFARSADRQTRDTPPPPKQQRRAILYESG